LVTIDCVATKPNRAALYTRLSKDKDGQRPNIAMQERLCREHAARKGWKVADVYSDRDRTAAGRDPFRPEYDRLKLDIKSGAVDGIVALDQDRLVREPYEFELLLRLCEDVGLTYITTTEGDLDITEGRGLLEARIRAAIASEEISKMKKRHKRAQQQLALDGKPGGGYRPFGYEDDHLTVRENEKALLHEAAERVILGENEHSISVDWSSRGVTTSRGGKWNGKRLREKLQQPRYAGKRVHHGEVVADAAWEPIFDTSTWAALQEHYANRPTRAFGHPPRTYIGSGADGLFRCGVCEQPVRARPRSYKGNSIRSYICLNVDHPKHKEKGPGHACIRIDADPVEEKVAKDVIASIDTESLAKAMQTEAGGDDERKQLVSDLQKTERALTTAEERYLEGGVSKRAFENVKARHQSEITKLRQQLARSEKSAILMSLPSDPEELWQKYQTATVEWKRAFLATFVEAVYLLPAKHRGQRGIEGRVRIEPRQ
jgi:site-specific DNA recombinase